MARSWFTLTAIVVLITGLIASSQGRSENSNTNINTNNFGRRSNANTNINTNTNAFEQRAREHLRYRDAVDFNAENNESTVSNSREDGTSTIAGPLRIAPAPAASSTNKLKKTSKPAITRRQLAQNPADDDRRAMVTSEIIRSINAAFYNELTEVTTAAIVEAVTRIISEQEKQVDESGRSTRRNYNMNSNTNTFGMGQPQRRQGKEKLEKLKRGFPEDFLPNLLDVPEPEYEELEDSEEDTSDSIDSNVNTNINSNTNSFGSNPDDDQPYDFDYQERYARRHRRRPVPDARDVTPIESNDQVEEVHRGNYLASVLRAARAKLAGLSENNNFNSNTNEFRRAGSRLGFNSRMRKRQNNYPDEDYYDDYIIKRGEGTANSNVNSNTNMNTFRRSGNYNENSNSNYIGSRQ